MNASVLAAIGNTPLVEIRRLNPNPQVRILAKLEYFNPGGSIKDRPALYMIEAAERSGELTPEKTVIEATSGNTGIGLALVCAVKGYRLLLAMAESVSLERRKILKARGADILLTPGHLGTDGAIEEVYRLARENPGRYFVVDQFSNEANWKAHYHGTAEEIWRQTRGSVTMAVAPMGTTGTLMGLSRRLKEFSPAVTIVGVEPYLGHRIQGLKNLKEAYCPEIFEAHRLDRKVNIEDEEAFETARRLAREEGLFVGMSSGAAAAAALREAGRMTAGTIVVVLPDGGERYLSTPLFSAQEKLELRLYNLMHRGRELFEPLKAEAVSVYTCGARAGRSLQLGEARRLLLADVLCRYLRWRGVAVTHAVDILDPASPHGGQGANGPAGSTAGELKALGVQPADLYLRPQDKAEEMVGMARRLVSKGFAYEKLRSLYFDLSRLPDYGLLSGVDPAKIKAGATAALAAYEKHNPRDFALLKRCRLPELKRGDFIKTEWGSVRPSWHLQTAALSIGCFGVPFDIHTSSRELLFPHHENENALALALAGKPLARFWVHCDHVADDGNCLADLLALGFSGREVRFWMMAAHYRKPLVFSAGRLQEARRALRRLDRCRLGLTRVQNGAPHPEVDQLIYDIRHGVSRALDDDLNLPAAIAALFQTVTRINSLAAQNRLDGHGAGRVLAALKGVDAVLGLFDWDMQPEDDPEIRELAARRAAARAEKNWALADRLRDALRAKGVTVQDTA
jgi:cysteinyl-tRNA synthetase